LLFIRFPEKKMVFIAPAKISDIASWFQYYKHGKTTNLVVRPSDGALLVLDKDLNRESPVKVLEVPRAVDALVALQGAGAAAAQESLRASATTRMDMLTTTRRDATAAAEAAYREREQALLEAVEAWKQAEGESARRQAAVTVGELQKDLAALDAERRAAKYPHRYIRDDMVSRMHINYEERNESNVNMWVTQHPLTVAAERSIEVGTA
jgi:hypothetical protein